MKAMALKPLIIGADFETVEADVYGEDEDGNPIVIGTEPQEVEIVVRCAEGDIIDISHWTRPQAWVNTGQIVIVEDVGQPCVNDRFVEEAKEKQARYEEEMARQSEDEVVVEEDAPTPRRTRNRSQTA